MKCEVGGGGVTLKKNTVFVSGASKFQLGCAFSEHRGGQKYPGAKHNVKVCCPE